MAVFWLKAPFYEKEDLVLTIPNPHKGTIGVDLLTRILKQALILRGEWLEEKDS